MQLISNILLLENFACMIILKGMFNQKTLTTPPLLFPFASLEATYATQAETEQKNDLPYGMFIVNS